MKNSDEGVRQEMADQTADETFAERVSVVIEVEAYVVANLDAGPVLTAACDKAESVEHAPLVSTVPPALNDNRRSDERLDQYYTQTAVAAYFYRVFQEHFDPARYLMVEPSAGTGSFYKLLLPGSLGYDVDPKYPGIETADFLTVKIASDRDKTAAIGNPPFGKNASMAVRFFNHAARQSSVIALILPRSFRKASIQNRLDRDFHLVWEETVPENAFLFEGKPYSVPAVFQVWERRSEPRALMLVETKHPDFEFITPGQADFAIQRVGARAGRVHRDFTASPSSHYFIQGNVEAIMAQLDFASVVGDVAGNPSLAKTEIVSLYREFISIPTLLGGLGLSERGDLAMTSVSFPLNDWSSIAKSIRHGACVMSHGVNCAVAIRSQHPSCAADAWSRAGSLVAGISAQQGETIHSRCSRGIIDYRRYEVATGAGKVGRSTFSYPKGPPNARRPAQ
jgi:predicted RNA methylase